MIPEEFAKIMDIDDLVAVHLTKYLPENGQIKSLNSVFPEETLRNTVHFAINHPVEGHMYGSWDGTSYAVIVPLDKLCGEEENEILNFNVVDTYFAGDVKLPTGSTVIVSSAGYDDLIEQGIVDRNTLIANFCDERNPPPPNSRLVVERDGIKYIILGWNNDSLHDETSKEIARQEYKSMKGGMWNWSCPGGWGASTKDQQRIADKLGAEHGIHSASIFSGLEYLSGRLSSISYGQGRKQVEAYLDAVRRLGGVDEVERKIDDITDDEYEGRVLLRGKSSFGKFSGSEISGLVSAIEKLKAELPHDLYERIDRFIESNRAEIRTLVPEEYAQQLI